MTRSIVAINWLTPSSARNSHWIGITTWLAAVKPLIVSRPSEGGQSMSARSYVAPTVVNACLSRCSRRTIDTRSTSAAASAGVVGNRSTLGLTDGTIASAIGVSSTIT